MVGELARRDSTLYSSASVEWYTPDAVLAAVAAFLGDAADGLIDLDPCAEPTRRVPARTHLVGAEGMDGLAASWAGTVFVNPPYGAGIAAWTTKFATDPALAEGVLLLPARTETRAFAPLFAFPICFVRGRMRFLRGDGSRAVGAPFPSALVYRGPRAAAFAAAFAAFGPTLLPPMLPGGGL